MTRTGVLSIPARPTTYCGIKMRSRLEARYAAYLDREGRTWQYEPRAYANATSQYLPDFEVVDADIPEGPTSFVEVRPNLDGVRRAMAQMLVIWDSEPLATLVVAAPDLGTCWWTSGQIADGRWRTYKYE